MGDRAYVRITCRREDAERFRELGFVEVDAENKIAVSMVDDEANYAHYGALNALAKAGIVYFGWHEPGCEYDGSMFASDGTGEYHEVLSTPNEPLALVCPCAREAGRIHCRRRSGSRPEPLRGARRGANEARARGGGIGMTRLTRDSRVRRETSQSFSGSRW